MPTNTKKHPPQLDPDNKDHRPRVAVKLSEQLSIPLTENAVAYVKADSPLPWKELTGIIPGLELDRTFNSVSPQRIKELTSKAVELDPSYTPVDLNTWFTITLPKGADPEKVVKFLQGLSIVETAYVESPPVPPPGLVNNSLNDLYDKQGYLDAAPNGIGAKRVWDANVPGSDGAGTNFVDVEQGWDLTHEDLPPVTVLYGASHGFVEHGTCVLGVVAAVDNDLGVVGIAPRTTASVSCEWDTGGALDTHGAIIKAIDSMGFGDVLLLESQVYKPFPGAGSAYVPVECELALFDAVRLATALGIVVVEAAADGGQDLDNYLDSGKRILDRSSADFRDSGAIMVAACFAPGSSVSTPFTWYTGGNQGNRIDCFAWGELVMTTSTDRTTTAPGYVDYTSEFNSTSSASAIIAGAALSVQGMAKASAIGNLLGPLQLRAVLSDPVTGTTSVDPATDKIGVMPDLERIATDVLSLLPDVYMRDHVGDDGDPHRGPVSISPDVIVTTAAVADPQAAYGEGSGTENDFSLGDVVTPGVPNNVFVRMRDRGGADATNVDAIVYWSPPATLVTPDLWNRIGKTTLPLVPMGNILTVSNAIPWPAADVPASGHACFVAIIGNALDPAPLPADFKDMDQFALFISRNNNVTWKNFNVVPLPPPAPMMSPMRMPFWLTGPHDKPHTMRVELVSQLPKGATAHLSIPEPAADLFNLSRHGVKKDTVEGRLLIPINAHGRHILGETLLPKHLKAECDLVVHQPEGGVKKACEVSIRQFFKELEIGRITWRFEPHKKKNEG